MSLDSSGRQKLHMRQTFDEVFQRPYSFRRALILQEIFPNAILSEKRSEKARYFARRAYLPS